MKNTVKSNFSLRKLILTALVAGPVAILPAPLWALPSTAAANLTTSTGVQVVTAGTALNITSPDKGILTWVDFGGNGQTIASTDTLNYILPTASASVLNLVTGAASTTINGTLVSNGNVYIMNKNGIVIGSGASINAGGFYASSIDEPLAASSFAANGTLSYVGTGSGSVTVSHTNSALNAPVIQALGTGNNIVLAGATGATAVDVQSGAFYGNLTTRSTGGGVSLAGNTTAAFGSAVSVSGNLTVLSNGGAVALSNAGNAANITFPNPAAGSYPAGAVPIVSAGSGYVPGTYTVSVSPFVKVGASPFVETISTSLNNNAGFTPASYTYVVDSTGKIASFNITNGGTGFVNGANGNNFSNPTPTGQTLSVGGNLNVTTAGGAISNDGNNRVSVTGSTTLNTAGAAGFGSVTLPNVDFSTLNLTSVGKTTVTDQVGGITLGNGSITASDASATQLIIASSASSSSIAMSSGAKISVNPTATNLTPGITLNGSTGSVAFTGTGALTFTSITSSTTGTATISADKDVTISAISTRGLSVSTSGGNITVNATIGGTGSTSATIKLATTGLGDIAYNGNIWTTGTVDMQATNGKVTVGGSTNNANTVGASSIFKASGDVAVGINNVGTAVAGLAAPSGVTIQSTGGQVTLGGAFSGNGTISAATSVILTAASSNDKADISSGTFAGTLLGSTGAAAGSAVSFAMPSGGSSYRLGAGYNPNTNYELTVTAAPVGGTTAAGFATTDSAGRIASVTFTTVGAGYTATPTINVKTDANNLPTNAIVANGALAISAGSGSVSIPGPIVSTSTSELSISSAQTLTLPYNITAPTLKLTSTGSNISQAGGSIVSTSKATLAAATNINLDTATNNFNQVVVTNTPGGAVVSDLNGIVIGGGTDVKGDLVVKAGQAGNATNIVSISSPLTTYTLNSGVSAANNILLATTNGPIGSVTGVTVPSSANQTGYNAFQGAAGGADIVTLTFSAPPVSAAPTAASVSLASTSASTSLANTGYVLADGQIKAINVRFPLGNGYAPGTRVGITVTDATPGAVPATGYATANSNGQISSITITNPGSGQAAPSITFAAPNGDVPVTATGYAVADATGKLTSMVITNPGAAYYGSYVPTVTIAVAPTGTTATATTATNANNAVTGINITGAGTNYSSAPTITLGNGATVTTAVSGNALSSAYPANTGTIALGTAAADVIKVAGNLTLSSNSPSGVVTTSATTTAANAIVSTVANTVNVTGTISATNNGAPVTFGGSAPIGSTVSYAFGGVAASIGTGDLSVTTNGALALGTITANSLTAKSVTGDITSSGAITLANGAQLTAKDIFAPGNITLNNAGNNIAGTIVVTNAKDFSLTNSANTAVQAGSAAVVGSAMTGLTTINTSYGKSITLTTAGGGDFGVVSFNAGGNVNITDPNGITLRNITNSGTSTVNVTTTNGPINLDSGISLGSTGLTTLTAGGATGRIVDTAAGINAYGPVSFSSSNDISLTKAGHSFGAVTLASGVGGATTSADIVYTENGTANLAGVTVNNNGTIAGSVAITSTSGAIIQSGAGTIALTGLATATQSATFTAATGVALNKGGNSFGGAVAVPVTITGGADSAVSANSALTLGNVRVNGGAFTVDTTASAAGAGAVAQATGSVASIYGNTSISTKGSAITVNNSGNNFGALTLASNVGVGGGAGADIALTENSTLNVNSANAGTGGKIALTSESGSIIQTAAGTGITGATAPLTAAISLTATKGNITLTGTNASNGAPITVSTTGNLALTDSSTATKLASGTTVTGTSTIRNTNGAGTVSDVSGGLLLGGAVLIDMTGAAATGNISITGSGNSFGAIQFRAATVTIAEDKTLNIAAGSLATGTATLSSLADIITSGAGSSIFSGPATSLTLTAGGNITITNPIAVANGLTFRALGAVDLSALSMANLNGKTPTNLGAASYKAPQP